MNTRFASAAVVALGIAAGCVLTACTPQDDRAPATSSSVSATKLPSPLSTPPASPSPSPPKNSVKDPAKDGFVIPADVKVTIDEDATGDPLKDEVLRYNGKVIMGLLDAEAGDGPADPTYKPFVTGPAAAEHARVMAGYLEKNWTITGDVRFWKRRVTIAAPDRATVLYCEDQRFFYAKDRTTNKVVMTTPSRKSFIEHVDVMVKSADGQWRQSEFRWTRAVENCQRPLDAPV